MRNLYRMQGWNAYPSKNPIDQVLMLIFTFRHHKKNKDFYLRSLPYSPLKVSDTCIFFIASFKRKMFPLLTKKNKNTN